jgi:uncharacterized RDD family membrane protein YckC
VQRATEETDGTPAGFWIRSCAGIIDLTLVTMLVVLAASVAASLGTYLPIELTVFVAYAVYTAIAMAWTGKTAGSWGCGLIIRCRERRIPGLARSSLRASLTALFQCLLGLPFLAVGLRRSGRGWHDDLAGTRVDVLRGCRTRRRLVVAFVTVTVTGWLAVRVLDAGGLYGANRAWSADARVAAAGAQSPPVVSAVEVSSVDDGQRRHMTQWLADHAVDPAESLIDVATRHQVTIVGEIHGQKQTLAFFNRTIPALYRQAGVRVLALECCHPDQDEDLARLTTGQHYDRELARQIARRAVWQAWGWKGYWDVLETAWRLNHSLSPDQEPLRVVGISPRFDGPSFALVRRGPWIEKSRIVRLIDDLPRLVFHDAHYARQVERQAFSANRRTVVWVGAAHASLRSDRMGSMLRGRYGDRVGQLVLHNDFLHGKVAHLIEQCADQVRDGGTAFDAARSPFAPLRDESAFGYARDPGRCFADLVSVYIMLVPARELEPCDWLDGFVSQHMLGRNRPFYEMLCDRKLADHHEANRHKLKGLGDL